MQDVKNKLDEIATDLRFLADTFIALEAAHSSSCGTLPKYALVLPTVRLSELSKRLSAEVQTLFKTAE